MPHTDDAQADPLDDESRDIATGGADRLRFYLYTVEGAIHGVHRTFGVVCCHASDALALIVRQLPDIDNLTVTRGGPVHYIAIGDHPLQQ